MKYLPYIFVLSPMLAHAQRPGNFADLVAIFLDIISYLIPLVFALTFIVFIWGIVKAWILRPGDEAEVEKGKKLLVVGIVGLVIMSAIWGILAMLRDSIF